MSSDMHGNESKGFSLIQLSIVLAVAGILVAAALPGNKNNQSALSEETVKRMVAIEQSLQGYRASNQSFPCPADGTLASTHANFGKEMGEPGACANGNFGVSGSVVGGIVPVKALGLPAELALDGWGRRFSYVVDRQATRRSSIITQTTETVDYVCNSGNATFTLRRPHRLAVNSSVLVTWQTPPSACGGGIGVGGEGESPDGGEGGVTVGEEEGPQGGEGGVTAGEEEGPQGGEGGITAGEEEGPQGGDSFPPGSGYNDSPVTVNGINSASAFSFPISAIGSSSGSTNQIRVNSALGNVHCDNTASFGITVTSNGVAKTAPLALLSHGPNGSGAFPSNGSATNARLPTGTNSDEMENADGDSALVHKVAAGGFDDIVRFTNDCL